MKKGLFSVILLHYNQPCYVKTALDSVFAQNYSDIELIFADDASKEIDLADIKNYIDTKKGENIKNVIYSINEQNKGTVKTINSAVKKCNGEHILFFAADDALCDSDVITNFANAFSKVDENVYMISSQCFMMDINLENKLKSFVEPIKAAAFNKMTASEQFEVFCGDCFLAIGATAMKSEMFEKFGLFNENYKFIEDWSYFLHLTRNGGLIKFVDFVGLLHRDGGISHYESDDKLPPHVMAYKYDMINIFEHEIIPYIKRFSSDTRVKTLRWYSWEKKSFFAYGGKGKTLSKLKLFVMFPKFYTQVLIYPITKSWDLSYKMLIISAAVAIISFVFSQKAKKCFLYTIVAKIFGVALLPTIYITLAIWFIKVAFSCLLALKKSLTKGKK